MMCAARELAYKKGFQDGMKLIVDNVMITTRPNTCIQEVSGNE
jgi:hypothetical protein